MTGDLRRLNGHAEMHVPLDAPETPLHSNSRRTMTSRLTVRGRRSTVDDPSAQALDELHDRLDLRVGQHAREARHADSAVLVARNDGHDLPVALVEDAVAVLGGFAIAALTAIV